MKFKQGSLDVKRGRAGQASKFRAGVLCAGAMAFALFCGFAYSVHKLGHGEMLQWNPMIPMLFPIIGGLFFAAVIPLLVFIVYSEDFQGMNPLLPHHYVFIMRKTFKAMETGNWKLSAKDL
mmetsp:Transcript_33650/g.85970  ORF Transcript_33650/g.85970 Transcript_33650/m.85970 type:complete len:121 (+) Transcript_33650:332-694(+)